MASGNQPKAPPNAAAATKADRKSRWEKPTATATANPATAKPQQQPTTKPNPNNPSPSSKPSPRPNQAQFPTPPGPGPIPTPGPGNLLGPPPPPPPAYGFHMLDRRSIFLADGSVRTYFALPPDYQDFPPVPRPDFMDRFGPRGPPEFGFRGNESDFANANPNKRKYGEDRDERDGKDDFARIRQQVLQFGNAGQQAPNGAGPSGLFGGDDARAAKYARGGGGFAGSKHNEVDQAALKKAFLHFVRVISENAAQRKSFLADGKQGPLQCLACGRSSKDFPDMHGLIMHAYNSESSQAPNVDHLGLHKALCVLMGWNFSTAPDNSKIYQSLSAEEAAANQDDLIMWPPVVIIHNTIVGKGRDGRMEGLGNREIDKRLSDLGFTSGKSKSMYGKEGHLGASVVKFSGDQSGLKEAVRLADFFEKDNHGRRAWASVQSLFAAGKDEDNPNLVKVDKKTGVKERIFYGYLGTAFDMDKVDFETKKKVDIQSRRDYGPAQ